MDYRKMVVIPITQYEALTGGKVKPVGEEGGETRVLDVPTKGGIVVKELNKVGVDEKGRLALDGVSVPNTKYQNIVDYLNDKKPEVLRAPNGTKRILKVLKKSSVRGETLEREKLRQSRKGSRRKTRELLKGINPESLRQILDRYG